MPYLGEGGLAERPRLSMHRSLAGLMKAAFWCSPVHWRLSHLAIAEMQAKVINVASWLRHNKLPLAAQIQMKSDCFLSDKPSNRFLGFVKRSVCPWLTMLVSVWTFTVAYFLVWKTLYFNVKVCITGLIKFEVFCLFLNVSRLFGGGCFSGFQLCKLKSC